jgi:hypothetical protein
MFDVGETQLLFCLWCLEPEQLAAALCVQTC